MKLLPVAAFLILCCSSCEEGWTDEHKQGFTESCLNGAATGGMTDAQKQAYCQCALEKTMQHYKNITEVVENKDSTQMSAALKDCYRSAVK